MYRIGNEEVEAVRRVIESRQLFKINNGLKEIGDSAFSHCKSLTDITVPASVSVMGERVFEYCISLPTT